MRNLNSHDRQGAEEELRADEILIPSGGITLAGQEFFFFSAASEEDFLPKGERLEARRRKRREKRTRAGL